MEGSVIVYKKSNVTRQKIKEGARKLFLTNGFEETKIIDIAKEINVSKGVILYHFKTKETLFYEVIEEVVRSELNGLVKHLYTMPADYAVQFLLTMIFNGNRSEGIQSIFDNRNLFEKCHSVVDSVRRKVVSPLILDLIQTGKNEGLFSIDEITVTCAILGIGFEGYIHNNYKNFLGSDHSYRQKFLHSAASLCNDTIKPTRIKFDFHMEINNDDNS